MDPVQSATTAYLQAVQAAQGSHGSQPATPLAALLGQDVNLLFQGSSPEGQLFALPSGQTVTLAGAFPFPEGTQLLARITGTGDPGGIRLQTLQTTPPAPLAILAPLIQGEGQALLGRLTQADPPAALEPLVQLFQSLGGSPPAEAQADASAQGQSALPDPGQPGLPAPTLLPAQADGAAPVQAEGQAGPAQGALPPQGAAAFQERLQALPESGAPQTAAPQTAAPAPGPQGTGQAPLPDAVRTALGPDAAPPSSQVDDQAWSVPTGSAQASTAPTGSVPTGAIADATSAWSAQAGASLPAGTAPKPLVQAALDLSLGGPNLPVPPGPAAAPVSVADLLRDLSGGPPAGTGSPPQSVPLTMDSAQLLDALGRLQAPATARHAEAPAGQGEVIVQLLRNLVARSADPAKAYQAATGQTAQAQTASGHATVPENWESWLKAGMKALSDPGVSPREAPFHAAQAKEGTSLFELPLPWNAQSPLQIWTETDRDAQGKGPKGGSTDRVLLGMSFSKLGETRLGIAKGPEGLQVRVWAQNPEPLLQAQPAMEEELKELDLPVDLKILPLEPGPGGVIPTIRSLATGSTFQVLG